MNKTKVFCPIKNFKIFKMNKKASNILYEYIIFILFSLLFFAMMVFVLGKVGSGAIIYEQVYAKKIALAIDSAKPNMEIGIDISDAYKINKNLGNSFIVKNNEVKVILSRFGSQGYTYSHFSDYDVEGKINENMKMLILNIKEKK